MKQFFFLKKTPIVHKGVWCCRCGRQITSAHSQRHHVGVNAVAESCRLSQRRRTRHHLELGHYWSRWFCRWQSWSVLESNDINFIAFVIVLNKLIEKKTSFQALLLLVNLLNILVKHLLPINVSVQSMDYVKIIKYVWIGKESCNFKLFFFSIRIGMGCDGLRRCSLWSFVFGTAKSFW